MHYMLLVIWQHILNLWNLSSRPVLKGHLTHWQSVNFVVPAYMHIGGELLDVFFHSNKIIVWWQKFGPLVFGLKTHFSYPVSDVVFRKDNYSRGAYSLAIYRSTIISIRLGLDLA